MVDRTNNVPHTNGDYGSKGLDTAKLLVGCPLVSCKTLSANLLAEDMENGEEVLGDIVNVGVAVGQRDCLQVDFVGSHGMENGQGVINAGIAVNDARASHGGVCSHGWRVGLYSIRGRQGGRREKVVRKKEE